ncbi:hypothetical protein GGR57DRAFT_519976 [Xylariaceae sp. FL1272]|nr:hypothetical protein GGR57DRAFT_519976 [Xylariaceae sp. FL1272]
MRIVGGPLVRKISPLGFVETFKYDLSGRLIQSSDALGYVHRTEYFIGPSTNIVRTTNSIGYTTQQRYDALGRPIEIADSGVNGSNGINRVLSRSEYNFTSKVTKSTNELGLVTTTQYAASARIIKQVDYLGNEMTYVHKDAESVTEKRINGDLRETILADGFGRTVRSIKYQDSGASLIGYQLVTETLFDGFGRIRTILLHQQPTDGTNSLLLLRKEIGLNLEDKPLRAVVSGLASSGGGHDGPVSTFDVCNRLVKLKNQLGQLETTVYNADGHKMSLTRYDGTVFRYTYDALGQNLTSSGPDGTTWQEWLPNGRLSKISRYDSGSISYAYTLDGSLNTVTYPKGLTQTYEIDEFSRVTRERDVAGRETVNSFDSFGRLASKVFGTDKIEYKFGTVNHFIGKLTGYPLTSSQSYHGSISYDGLGRQVKVVDQDDTDKLMLQTTYEWDSRNRLTESQVSSSESQDINTNCSEVMEYDGLGQLRTKNIIYTNHLISARQQSSYNTTETRTSCN